MTPPSLYIGIDAGGTRSRLLGRTREGETLIQAEGPGANPHRIGYEASARLLAELIQTHCRVQPLHRLAGVGLGVAGLGRPADTEAFLDAFHRYLPPLAPDRLVVLSDADLALHAAFGASGSGALIIAGTGSIVLARTAEGERVRAGGWGYLLGDEGGGYRIGQAGLQAVARAYDGGPPTILASLLQGSFDMTRPEHLVERVYRPDWSMAAVAPLVLQGAAQGDAVCKAILHAQTTALAGQAVMLLRTNPTIDRTLRFTGGLTDDAGFASLLAGALKEALPALDVGRLSTSPVEAAVNLAMTA
ncbi:MAG: BadF/BadG/BcrA/BcrD ATPase family protein [Rhodothermales bacterium]